MPKRWKDEQDLLEALSDGLVSAMSVFPKRLIRIDELVHTFHMPLSHMQILVLVESKDRSIGQLSAQLGIAKPNITPLVDALNERGMVERIHSVQDRRIVMVHLLPEGRACLEEIRKMVAAQAQAQLNKADMVRLMGALDTLNSVMTSLE